MPSFVVSLYLSCRSEDGMLPKSGNKNSKYQCEWLPRYVIPLCQPPGYACMDRKALRTSRKTVALHAQHACMCMLATGCPLPTHRLQHIAFTVGLYPQPCSNHSWCGLGGA